MSTYFDTLQTTYNDVPITENGVATVEFMSATEGVVALFDLFGTAAFGVVQSDMNGNIAKIRTRLLETGPEKSGTLELLVQNEGKPGDKKRTATEGLLWLLREELSVSFTKAYEDSLRKYHSIMLAMKACPYRKDFYAKLGAPQDRVNAQLEEWVTSLERIVRELQQFYEQGNYAKGL
ncbi:hypothetical protein CBS14141_001874 [Malassezia furfur]|nr:hypothetical protein CBS14141_001874 [Malassezia furfur]